MRISLSMIFVQSYNFYDATGRGWVHDAVQPLKTASVRFRGSNTVTFIVRPHLKAFHTGRLLTPGVEMVLELFCNASEFFIFGTKTSGTGLKHMVTLTIADVKATLHLCRVSLNSTVYASLQAERKIKRKTAKYPMVRSEIQSFSFDGGTTKFNWGRLAISGWRRERIAPIQEVTCRRLLSFFLVEVWLSFFAPWLDDDALSFPFSKSGFSVSSFFACCIYFPNGVSYLSMSFDWVEVHLAESAKSRQQIEASLVAS